MIQIFTLSWELEERKENLIPLPRCFRRLSAPVRHIDPSWRTESKVRLESDLLIQWGPLYYGREARSSLGSPLHITYERAKVRKRKTQQSACADCHGGDLPQSPVNFSLFPEVCGLTISFNGKNFPSLYIRLSKSQNYVKFTYICKIGTM